MVHLARKHVKELTKERDHYKKKLSEAQRELAKAQQVAAKVQEEKKLTPEWSKSVRTKARIKVFQELKAFFASKADWEKPTNSHWVDYLLGPNGLNLSEENRPSYVKHTIMMGSSAVNTKRQNAIKDVKRALLGNKS